jgi:IclR family acetate operon transcriptional repressor
MVVGEARSSHAGSSIQSVARALDLLEALSQDKLGLVDLGRRTGLQPSTTHRMLATLKERGYVERMADGRYTLGHRSGYLGGALSVRERELMTAVRPVMQRAHSVSRQTVHLTVLDGAEVVYIYQLVRRTLLNALVHDNVRVPVHVSACGKALIAFQPTDRPTSKSSGCLKPYTRQSILQTKDLEREIASVREHGFAVDRQEYKPHLCCIAAPIFDHVGRVVAAMSISGPSHEIRSELTDDFGELVVGCAQDASAALGYEATHPRAAA